MILTAHITRPKFGKAEQREMFLTDATEYYLYHGQCCFGEIRVGNGVHVIIYENAIYNYLRGDGNEK